MEDPVDTKWLQDSLVEDFAEARKTWDGPLPSKTFTIPSQDLLNPLKVYMSKRNPLKARHLLSPLQGAYTRELTWRYTDGDGDRKMPSANDVAQWINAMFKVYAAPMQLVEFILLPEGFTKYCYQNQSTKLNYLRNLL